MEKDKNIPKDTPHYKVLVSQAPVRIEVDLNDGYILMGDLILSPNVARYIAATLNYAAAETEGAY